MKVVAIPIETKVREFDGKLWLSSNLVKNGYGVILGPSDEVKSTLDITEPDIYISKDIGDSNIDLFKSLQESGVTVCGLDTEGGVYQSKDTYSKDKRKFLNHMDAFFAWGSCPAKAIGEHYKCNNNIFVTGNPRFDLLKPHLRKIYEEEATTLKDEYGRYILYNTNFTIANPFSQQQVDKHEEIVGSISQSERSYKSQIFYLFIESIFSLQEEQPDITYIIRPHPSEDNTTYEEIFSEYDNIFIEDSGDVRSWISGAEVVIHHDCTTGIESALMGTPVASYQPLSNEAYDIDLPQFVSQEINNRESLAEYVNNSIKNKKRYEMTPDQKNRLKKYFHNIDESAAESICRIIDSFPHEGNTNFSKFAPEPIDNLERHIKTSRWSNQIIPMYDLIQNIRGKDYSTQRRYRNQKLPGIDKMEINKSMDIFGSIIGFEDFTVDNVNLTNDTFFIHRSSVA
jgi:surface carbohydrate biosynthesis protein